MPPLQKQKMSLPFTKGLDTKTAQKLAAKPYRLENAVFVGGDLQKRNARKQLPAAIFGGGTQSSGEALFTYGSELTRINGGTLYGFSQQSQSWVSKPGGQNYCSLAKTKLIQPSYNAESFDHAVVGTVGVLVWLNGTNGDIYIAVYDVVTGTFYQASTIISGVLVAQAPRLIALGTKVVVLAQQSGGANLYSTVIDTTTPGTAPSNLSSIRSDVYTGSFTFDAFAYSTAYAVVAYATGAGGTDMNLIAVGPAGTVLASPAATTFAAVAGAAGLTRAISANRDTAGNVYVVFGDATNNKTRFFVASSSFASVVAATDIVTNGNWDSTTADAIVAASVEATTNHLTFVMTNARTITSSVYTSMLGKVVLGSAGIVTAFAELPSTQGMFITGNFSAYDGTFVFGAVNLELQQFLGTTYESLQSTAWVLDISGNVISRSLANVSGVGGAPYQRVCTSYPSGSSVNFFFTEQGRTQFGVSIFSSTGAIVNTSFLGVTRITVTKTSAGQLAAVKVGQTLYIGGGLPRTYDGTQVAEAGFALAPTISSLTPGGAGTGSMTDGAHGVTFCYAWTNAQGELVRGPPAVAQTVTVASGANTGSIAAVVLTMPESMRDLLPPGAVVFIEAYLTTASGTVYYRVQGYGGAVLGNLTNANPPTLSVTLKTSDANLQSGELLYTTGGVLNWEAPPPFTAACEHQNRMAILPSENPFAFSVSSLWVPFQQVRFSSFNTAYVPADTGPLTGCASMDGKLVLLTQSACYYTAGDGPDNLGNNQYPAVQRVAGIDAGPVPGSPVAVVPMGIVYQSSKGITLLDRALNQQLLGADVEAFSTAPWVLRSILLYPRLQQIHFQVDDGSDIPGTLLPDGFTSNGGYRLVYDYFRNQWSVDPNCGAQESCLYQGYVTQVRSDGLVWQETPGLYVEAGAPNSMLVETEWIHLDNIQGFQRLYYVELIGNYGSDFTLQLDVAYGYAGTSPTVPTYTETVTLDGATVAFLQGGAFNVRHHLGKKCNAVKFRIRDTNIRGNGSGMLNLTDLAIEVGIKKGIFKLPAVQTM